MSATIPALQLERLGVEFTTQGRTITVVDGVSLAVAPGECLALVGESGCGKTQLSLACLGLLAANGRARGSARLQGVELIGASEPVLQGLRGARIATVFQDPINALTPHLTIGAQLAETLRAHQRVDAPCASRRAVEALQRVGLDDAGRRARQYPHEFSGGMRQRVAIAMALIAGPAVLIADEPTTALDVTVQAQILELLRAALHDGLALLLISHDLGVVAGIADRVAVMYAGRIVELADVDTLYARPRHPYTRALLGAVPDAIAGRGKPLRAIDGQPPTPGARLPGCAFEPRCALRVAACRVVAPVLQTEADGNNAVACHLHDAGATA